VNDGFGRTIDYLRVSVTDRCNLRCAYCMPESGTEWLPHERILRYEDILRLCRIFASLGVTKYKLTGGEPLVRKGLASLAAGIRAIPGTQSVTLTTNGVALKEQLPALLEAGIDGINLSLDTLDRARYAALTRRDALPTVLEGLRAAMDAPVRLKLNCVAMQGSEEDWIALASLAKDKPLAVRFIELMPIGLGRALGGCTEEDITKVLSREYGPLTPSEGVYGNGPCSYFSLPGFAGRIGFISAMSHKFCAGCNRVRLTATGFLKTCLQYETGVDLAPLLSGPDEALRAAIVEAVRNKPAEHRFSCGDVPAGERRDMNQIGG
jgi:cyclic pyranopterin phosphate synthase